MIPISRLRGRSVAEHYDKEPHVGRGAHATNEYWMFALIVCDVLDHQFLMFWILKMFRDRDFTKLNQ